MYAIFLLIIFFYLYNAYNLKRLQTNKINHFTKKLQAAPCSAYASAIQTPRVPVDNCIALLTQHPAVAAALPEAVTGRVVVVANVTTTSGASTTVHLPPTKKNIKQ